MEGWIKLYRKISDNPIWLSEPFTRAQAWIDLILLATHKNSFIRVRGIKIDLNRSQIRWSTENLAARWQWSRGKVLRFLNELETVQQIVQQKNNIITVITILNWEKYQADGTTDGTTDGQQTVQQTVQQTDTNKNDKNEKNERNEKKTLLSERFEKWWETYPRKEDRKKAEVSFMRLTELKRLECEDMTPGWIQAHQQAVTPKQYIKSPTAYLNGERWNDDLEVIRSRRQVSELEQAGSRSNARPLSPEDQKKFEKIEEDARRQNLYGRF